MELTFIQRLFWNIFSLKMEQFYNFLGINLPDGIDLLDGIDLPDGKIFPFSTYSSIPSHSSEALSFTS